VQSVDKQMNYPANHRLDKKAVHVKIVKNSAISVLPGLAGSPPGILGVAICLVASVFMSATGIRAILLSVGISEERREIMDDLPPSPEHKQSLTQPCHPGDTIRTV